MSSLGEQGLVVITIGIRISGGRGRCGHSSVSSLRRQGFGDSGFFRRSRLSSPVLTRSRCCPRTRQPAPRDELTVLSLWSGSRAGRCTIRKTSADDSGGEEMCDDLERLFGVRTVRGTRRYRLCRLRIPSRTQSLGRRPTPARRRPAGSGRVRSRHYGVRPQ